MAGATSAFAIEDIQVESKEVTQKKQEKVIKIEDEKMFIKDIEISGSNVIKPEYILEKMQLHRGDEYNRDLLQTDLKRIYQMGFFSDKLKAIPIENPDHSITLKVIVEENMPMTDFTIEGNDNQEVQKNLDALMDNKMDGAKRISDPILSTSGQYVFSEDDLNISIHGTDYKIDIR